jgi:hypothetical protein
MRSITRLFGVLGTLADRILALASVVNTATDKLRLQLATESDPLALPRDGEAIDNAGPDNGSPSTKRGRKERP